jgi:catalase
MSATDRHDPVDNIVDHMADGVERQVQDRAVALWRRVDPDLGARIAQGLGLARRGAPVETDAR